MTNQNFLISNYVNHALIDAEIEKSNNFNSHLNIVKFELKFIPEEADKFKDIIGFIYSYLGFTPILYEGNNSFLVFIHREKIHSVVNRVKNMLMSIKIKFNIQIKGIGVTTYEKDEDKNELFERIHKFFMKSKVLQDTEIYYGTKYFEYSHLGNFDNVKEVMKKDPILVLYGFYKEAPLMSKVSVLDLVDGAVVVKTTKEYLPFLKQQDYIYVEHSKIPDIMRANVINIDTHTQEVKLDNLKFIDDSPVHRKNIRITPHQPIKSTLEYQNEFQVDGLLSDISIKSVLLTVKLVKIEELQAKSLQTKSFQVKFNLTNSKKESIVIETRAMIYKIVGNQIILNIYPTAEINTQITEYIAMCQSLLLREVRRH